MYAKNLLIISQTLNFKLNRNNSKYGYTLSRLKVVNLLSKSINMLSLFYKPSKLFWIPVLLLFILASCNSKKENDKQDKAITVQATQIDSSTTSKNLSLSGNVEARETLRLGFMVAGKVKQITLKQGEKIQKGALLADLDATEYNIGLHAAKAKLIEVQDQYDRLKIMYERNSIPEADFIKVKSGLEQAKAQKQLREKNVRDTRLYAPIEGVLLKKMVSEGEIIDKGMPLFALADIDKIHINTSVPEGEINRVKIDQEAEVEIPALDTTYMGKVIEVGLAAEAETRTYTAKIEIENPQRKILPGMIAQLNLETQHKVRVLSLPGRAIINGSGNNSYVYVLDKEKNRAFKRDVSVGKMQSNEIEITSGLEPGEWVITGGQQKLSDGSLVTTN